MRQTVTKHTQHRKVRQRKSLGQARSNFRELRKTSAKNLE
jgi:hypothetical protein